MKIVVHRIISGPHKREDFSEEELADLELKDNMQYCIEAEIEFEGNRQEVIIWKSGKLTFENWKKRLAKRRGQPIQGHLYANPEAFNE